MSSTKKTPAHPAYNLLDTAAAAAAAATEAAEAATEAAEAATTAAAAATTAAEVASGFGGEVVEAVEAGIVGYGPDLAGFGLANESASESKNIQHALELRSSSREASGAAPGNTDRA